MRTSSADKTDTHGYPADQEIRNSLHVTRNSRQPSPEGYYEMNCEHEWTVYRTRFLVRACQLTEPMVFTDALGREHSGGPGDYLVESSEGCFRITARKIFEDVYVPLAASPPNARAKPTPIEPLFHPGTNREAARPYTCGDFTGNAAPSVPEVGWFARSNPGWGELA